MSILRVNNIEVRTGSAVTFSSNIDITGSFDAAGIVTARSGVDIGTPGLTNATISSNGDANFLGSVGIGTTNPTSNLHLYSNGDATLFIQADADNVDEDHNPKISMSQDGGTSSSFDIGITGTVGGEFTDALSNTAYIKSVSNATTQGIQFATNGGSRMFLDNNGNLGIGTINATAKLDVAGAATFAGTLQADALRSTTDGVGNFSFIAENDASRDTYSIILRDQSGLHIRNDVGGQLSGSDQNIDFAIGNSTPVISFGAGGSATFGDGNISLDSDGRSVFATASTAGTILDTYFTGAATGNFFRGFNNGTETCSIAADGSATFNGNISFPDGQGIDFSATAGSGISANGGILDDYEEGTFTVTMQSDNNDATISTNNTTGYYIKVGGKVSFTYYSSVASCSNAGTGGARLKGLPFTASNSTIEYWVCSVSHNGAFFSNTIDGGYVANGNTEVVFQESNTTTTANFAIGSNKYLMVSGTYSTV